MEIAGIQMVINPDNDAYEVEIPEAKAVYMHMLGHDCHSIVAGAGHADAIIANLKGYLDRGFQIFLSAHYEPRPGRTSRPRSTTLRCSRRSPLDAPPPTSSRPLSTRDAPSIPEPTTST